MTIQLSPQIERVLREALVAGKYDSVEDVLAEAVDIWQRRRTQSEELRQSAIDRLRTFGKDHGLSLGESAILELRQEARP